MWASSPFSTDIPMGRIYFCSSCMSDFFSCMLYFYCMFTRFFSLFDVFFRYIIVASTQVTTPRRIPYFLFLLSISLTAYDNLNLTPFPELHLPRMLPPPHSRSLPTPIATPLLPSIPPSIQHLPLLPPSPPGASGGRIATFVTDRPCVNFKKRPEFPYSGKVTGI